VLVGTGAAIGAHAGSLPRALLAAVVALALQVAVNYANDYSDGVRGTDADRVGPLRLTASGLARPGAVKRAAFAAFAVAGVAGVVLVALAGTWWLLLVGAAAIVAAWTYTGGPRPYGYAGLGEVFVFVFFGLVATLGTTYTQVGRVTWPSVAGAVAVGCLACAVLVVNNLRDVPTDAVAGKRTLAVRIGAPATRRMYVALLALPFVLLAALAPYAPGALAVLLALPLAVRPAREVLTGARGRSLVAVLGHTGSLELVYAVLLAVGLAAGTLH
jgi:1,4-dihydroxy-2-naphthoate octaprenyltransferase